MRMPDPYVAPVAAQSALLTIDVQNDFTRPGAPAEIPGTEACLPAMRRVLEGYRRRRLPIVHVVRLYRPDGSNADLCRRTKIEDGSAIVAPGSPGAELPDALKPNPAVRLEAEQLLSGSLQPWTENEWVLYKPRWDAFYATPLETHLRELGVTTVVVVGCNFPNCPRATVYGASMRDFRIALVADAVSGVYEQGLQELRNIGVSVMSTEGCLDWLQHTASRADPALGS